MKVSDDTDQLINIAYLAPELGALTSTFIYREVQALQKRGISIRLFSTTRPDEGQVSHEARSIIDETTYLYDARLLTILAGALNCLAHHPLRFCRAFVLLIHDILMSQTPSPYDRIKMLWHFLTGCRLATFLEHRHIQHVHAHFAHVPAAMAMYAGGLAGIPFSFTAHANDLFERGTALKEKVGRSAFAVAISDYNRRFLINIGGSAGRIHVVHCGLDVTKYKFRPAPPANTPPLVFSVGRFVEKKGFAILLEALSFLKQGGTAFHCVIAGTGPLYEEIDTKAQSSGLLECVDLPGAMPQERVKEIMGTADVFVLPCVVAESGDRDGIPVALMEAMALGIPVVSTDISGIPELIVNDENGLLVAPQDPLALSQALTHLLQDPAYGETLAKHARRTIEERFNLEIIAANLESLFRESISQRDASGGQQ
ncbi:MAG: glycosyltransferase family 4 protein [Candidatus Hydrogenedentota bacterium]